MIFLLLLCTALCSHLFCADPSSRRFLPYPTEEQIATGIASMRHRIGQRLQHRLPTPWSEQAAQQRDEQTRAQIEDVRTTRRAALLANRRSTHPQDPTSRIPAITRRPDTPADRVLIPGPPPVSFGRDVRNWRPYSRSRILAQAERFHRPSTPPPSTAESPRAGIPDYTPPVVTLPADEDAMLRDILRTEFPDLTPREIEDHIAQAERLREYLELCERAGNPRYTLIP